MELGLLRDFFGNFSMRGERYYFRMEGSTRGEIEPTQGEIEMNVGNIWSLYLISLPSSGTVHHGQSVNTLQVP